MPTWRKLHVKTTESLDLDAMPDDFTRLLWVMLPLKLCKHGRGVYSAAWVRSKVFPLRDDVTQDMVQDALDWLTERGMMIDYMVEGRSYFFVPSFPHYQGNTSKEADSDYPAPPDELQTYSRPTPELVESKSASDADADADADADVEADNRQQSDAAAGHALLEGFGVEEPNASKYADRPTAHIEGYIEQARGKAGLANPQGWVVSQLKSGIPPPVPKQADPRRFIEGEYADVIEH